MARNDETAIHELGWYVRNCAQSAAARRLERFPLERLNRLEGVFDDDDDGVDDSTAARRARLTPRLRRLLKNFAAPPPGDYPAARNAQFARAQFALDEIELEILLLLLRYKSNNEIKALVDEIEQKFAATAETISVLIDAGAGAVDERLRRDATLVACGLVSLDRSEHGIGGCGYIRLSSALSRVMFENWRTRAAWLRALTGAPLAPSLAWDDFAHLGEAAYLARQVAAGAVRTGAKGINILFHGPVGTGKTEFCKVLAAQDDLALWAVAEEDDNRSEPERCERLASLSLLQRLLGSGKRALILFDEAEDLLEQPGAFFGLTLGERNGSKIHINRLIENNPVPILWTCNAVERIDPAVLRRMTLAIEVKTPGKPARVRIWRRALELAQVKLDDDAVVRLAGRFEAPAAVAANAARAAALAKGGEKEIENALSGVLSLLGLPPKTLANDGLLFDARFVNCAENVARLAEALSRPGAPLSWSLCISGAPGTGKSEYARHLARRLGLETMQRRASDIFSMWVGQSEKAIASAFAEARANRAMLIFDEADSLLGDRRSAIRSWEVSQVNEMLTWMEQHPLPFVCTTNLSERLDQASLRRFTLKLRFEPLAREQAAQMFAHAFGLPAPEWLPDALTPGDFATVRRRAQLFGETNPSRLADWLAEEVEARGHPARPIGFAA